MKIGPTIFQCNSAISVNISSPFVSILDTFENLCNAVINSSVKDHRTILFMEELVIAKNVGYIYSYIHTYTYMYVYGSIPSIYI